MLAKTSRFQRDVHLGILLRSRLHPLRDVAVHLAYLVSSDAKSKWKRSLGLVTAATTCSEYAIVINVLSDDTPNMI